MTIVVDVLLFALAAGIVNVWLIRPHRSTAFRPDGANNIIEEFRAYGLSSWVAYTVGAAKLTLAAMLLVGIVYRAFVVPAAGAMALLMLVAVAAHLKVRDPLVRAAPALSMLLLCVGVITLSNL